MTADEGRRLVAESETAAANRNAELWRELQGRIREAAARGAEEAGHWALAPGTVRYIIRQATAAGFIATPDGSGVVISWPPPTRPPRQGPAPDPTPLARASTGMRVFAVLAAAGWLWAAVLLLARC